MSKMLRARLLLVSGILAGTGLLAAAPASAQSGRGISSEDFETGIRMRSGTGCKLVIDGDEIYRGLCNVARRGSVTVIDTGTAKYRIERDDVGGASLFRGSRLIDDTLVARGPCWRGEVATYCAH